MFDAATWDRGAAYAAQGRVLKVRSDINDNTVTSTVKGSGRKVYTQTIFFNRNSDGSVRNVSGDCSCPVGYNCKHVAAVLYEHARSPQIDQRPSVSKTGLVPEPALPHTLAFWLDALRQADTGAGDDPDGWSPQVRDRLLYVVMENASGQLVVDTMKSTLLRDGGFGGRITRYDTSRALRSDPPKFIRPMDMRILRRIDMLGLGVYADSSGVSYGKAEPGEILDLLRLVAATGRGRWLEANGSALRITDTRKAVLFWKTQADGSQTLGVSDEAGRALKVLATEPPVFVDTTTGEIGPLTLDASQKVVSLLLKAPAIPAEYAGKVADALKGLGTFSLPTPHAVESEIRHGRDPVPILRLFATPAVPRYAGWGRQDERYRLATLRLAFDYDGRLLPFSSRQDERFLENGKAVTLQRDSKAERQALRRLKESGAVQATDLSYIRPGREAREHDLYFPDQDGPDGDGASTFFEGGVLQFTAQTVPDLRREGWTIDIDPDWPYPFYGGPVEIGATVMPHGGDRSGDGFSLGLQLRADEQQLDLAPLILKVLDQLAFLGPDNLDPQAALETILEDMTFYPRLTDGRFIELDASVLLPLLKVFLSASGLLDGFHRAEAGRLRDVAEALEGCGVVFEGGPDLITLGARLRSLANAAPAEPPSSFCATLRPYQKTGYGWLQALGDTGFGGILADDMGLGKTVQTLALLVSRHLERSAEHPSLLVVPTSIAHSWRRQAALFAPGLKVLVLQGATRKSDFDAIGDHHLVITTYPLLNRDHAALMPRAWEIAVLDEAQAVKNPASAVAKRIREIDARMRVALTGTPMENTLSDLWALYDWLIPGLLGDRKGFRARFLVPIEKHGDVRAQAELNARIRPFLLRRTKAQVALDLPEKTEITEFVSLGDRQRALYETMRLTMDERVRKTIAEKGLAASHITILDALLKLRQICCDPKLLKHQDAGALGESAKRERLMELLDDLVAEGRRVLVFSQFVEMLKLIETDVKARNWPYAWLTGDTVNRDDVVTQFQSSEIPLFLISLKAGGVGLTLTAADTVILYDPWWNPATERQAMDRVHRIGQEKHVFVYRLIAEGSVEQAISVLQERKQALADALFEGTANGPLSLDESEIAALFRPMEHSRD
jgi:hypothetical protein